MKQATAQLALPLDTAPAARVTCACHSTDAQACADSRYPGSFTRRLKTGEEGEPCTCGCHEDPDATPDDSIPW